MSYISDNWRWPDDWTRIDWSREFLRPPSSRELTPREKEVLYCCSRGQTYKQIAHKLGLSEQTIKNYLSAIRDKLDVQTTMAAVWKMRKQLEDEPQPDEVWLGWGI